MQTAYEGISLFTMIGNHVQVLSTYQSILSVFRSIANLEKSVETCAISLPRSEALLIIELKCKHGIAKMFNLRYYECESVEVSNKTKYLITRCSNLNYLLLNH